MSKIIIIPTSHIARESIENVEKAVKKERPECLAVELDIKRYYAFRQHDRIGLADVLKTLGLWTGLLYVLLKKMQEYLGTKTGILPGSEMVHAVDVAIKHGMKVAFIDRPIEKTFMKIKSLDLTEKLKLMLMLVVSFISLYYPLKRGERVDLNKVPKKGLIKEAMNYMKTKLPKFYKILVEERDEYMAKNLDDLSDKFEKIVCVVGAGHVEGLKKLLNNRNVKFTGHV
ncbi:MAG: TraB/GumN family protein [Candidatus Aenigmarchaeota archaeon]|nr:TraB/GumN family protein [Candidatus Aenigmarchaeota archaeon]